MLVRDAGSGVDIAEGRQAGQFSEMLKQEKETCFFCSCFVSSILCGGDHW